MRMVLSAVLVVLIAAGGLRAEPVTISGLLKSVDAEKNVLTLKIKDKEREFLITKETKIFSVLGPRKEEIKDGLKSELFQKADRPVLVKIEEKDGGKEEVKEVTIVLGKAG